MRLSKIATRTGDDGTTGLADGSRLPKDSPRIEAIGAVDELNSQIGLLLTEALPHEVREGLAAIQHELFDLGGELAHPNPHGLQPIADRSHSGLPGHDIINADQVTRLDGQLERFNADLPPLKEFILPGGSRAAALCHVARTVCRRAERHCVALARQENLSPAALQYLNRLSDLLFVLARVINRADGNNETLWRR